MTQDYDVLVLFRIHLRATLIAWFTYLNGIPTPKLPRQNAFFSILEDRSDVNHITHEQVFTAPCCFDFYRLDRTLKR